MRRRPRLPKFRSSPASIPDGANEFTFSDATVGILTLKLKVHLPGVVDQSAADQAKYTFTVDAIGSSALSWGTAGGQATVSGEYLTATATFTGLPQNNTDFGSKTVRLKYDGNEVANAQFEVFFMRDETNHPGNGAGNDPNWFYYWRLAAGAQNMNLVYGGTGPERMNAKTIGMTEWRWDVAPDKTKVVMYDIAKNVDEEYGANQGAEIPTGIDAFFSCLLHEQRHLWQITTADALLGNLIAPGTPWRYGWSWNTDYVTGLNTNHFTPGVDGIPGVANYDDDHDEMMDNIVVTARGELGWGKALIKKPPEGLVDTDDVALGSWPITASNYDWPAAWPVPAYPAGCFSPFFLEWDAINAAQQHKQDQSISGDWASPGKQHQTKKYND